MPRHSRTPWQDRLVDRAVRLTIGAMLLLPYRWRVPLAGWLFRQVGRMVGYRDRAEENLSHIFPDMPAPERRRIARAVLDNFGRVLIENYSFADRMARAETWPPEGPGWADCEAARKSGRPIIVVSGHFGNYQAMQVSLNVRGYRLGGIYRPMNNPYLNAHYVRTFTEAGGPAFARGRRGLAQFVKHLRAGGQTAMLIDQYFADGVQLDFLGQPAPTSLSAAEMALKYDALLVPIYAERKEDGLGFTVTVESPIPHSDPRRMTQALNDSLAARVRARPDQWLWVHRRWKPGRQARYFPPFAPDEDAIDPARERPAADT